MKTLAILGLAGAVAAGLAPPAFAFKFAPPGAGFSASGSAMIGAAAGGQYECKLSIRGVTTAKGKAKITAAVFSPGASACANTVATGLPWKAKATGAATAKISNLALTSAFGPCGPASVPVAVSGGGLWTISAAPVPPACATFSAMLPTAPPIVIVP